MARSLALHHILIPIHTPMPMSIHTPTHTHTHTFRLRLTRISTNTCIYITHHTSMLVSSSLLFLVCPASVHKARAMARFLFQDSGLCFNRSLWKQSPKLVSVSGQHKPKLVSGSGQHKPKLVSGSGQHKPEVIPVQVWVPRLGQILTLQERPAQASLLSK